MIKFFRYPALSLLFFCFFNLTLVQAETFAPSSCGELHSTDLATEMAYQVDSRIAGLTANDTTRKVFSARGNGSGGWTRNNSVWTSLGSSALDLTGLSPWNSNSNALYRGAGTLITPQHMISADHYTSVNQVGATVAFVDSDNNVITRTIAANSNPADDIKLSVLNEPLPSSIAYYPIIPQETLRQYLSASNTPFLILDQNAKAKVFDLDSSSLGEATGISFTAPSGTSDRFNFYETWADGDSGNGQFIIINNQPILMAPTRGNGNTFVGAYVDEISTAIASLETSTGLGGEYSVSDYDLSCFEPHTYGYPTFPEGQSFSIPENSANDTEVGTVSATGADTVDGVYSFAFGGVTAFTINSNTGVITVNNVAALDYETTPSFSLSTSVRDSWSKLYTNGTITINVTNVNENPIFSSDSYSVSLPESTALYSTIGTVSATPYSGGETITYRLDSGNTGNTFSINSSTGAIKLYDTLDYDAHTSYSLIVRATSNTASRTSTTTFDISIQNPQSSNRSTGGGGGRNSTTKTEAKSIASITSLAEAKKTFSSLSPLGPKASAQELNDRIDLLKKILEIMIQANIKPLATSINKNLNFGSVDESVRELQKILNRKGYTVSSSGPGSIGKETNVFGKATQAALVKFQLDNNLLGTGNLDDATRLLINR